MVVFLFVIAGARHVVHDAVATLLIRLRQRTAS
jgi:formate/nitrite transporter FocA (FNT family)